MDERRLLRLVWRCLAVMRLVNVCGDASRAGLSGVLMRVACLT